MIFLITRKRANAPEVLPVCIRQVGLHVGPTEQHWAFEVDVPIWQSEIEILAFTSDAELRAWIVAKESSTR